MRPDLDTGNSWPRTEAAWSYMVTYGEGPRRRPDMRSDLWHPVRAARCELVPELVEGQYQRWFGRKQEAWW